MTLEHVIDIFTADTELYHQFLLIDYQYVRLYINSLALQTVAGRMIKNRGFGLGSQFDENSHEYGFICEVVNGCREILKMVVELSNNGHLKYMPVRIHIRIASASIYLINVRSDILSTTYKSADQPRFKRLSRSALAKRNLMNLFSFWIGACKRSTPAQSMMCTLESAMHHY